MDFDNTCGYFTQPQPYFTNTHRKLHVQVIKKGDNLSMLLNGKPFANSSDFTSRYGKPCGDVSVCFNIHNQVSV